MTVSQILARSSNVGALTIARLLGPVRLAAWIKRFGFGKPPGPPGGEPTRFGTLALALWNRLLQMEDMVRR